MLWYLICEFGFLLFLLSITRGKVINTLLQKRFLYIIFYCSTVGLLLDFLATNIFNMWSFQGDYAVKVFNLPIMEEAIFYVLMPLGFIHAWEYLKPKEEKLIP